jgi:hypothetical protein
MISEILKMSSGLDVHETRSEKPEYHEMVVYTKDLDSWEKIFREALGMAVKPPGSKATNEHILITEEYGGIDKGQTLYVRKTEEGATMIMLWPWQDGERITVKMVFIKGV